MKAANTFLSTFDDKQRQSVLFAFNDEQQRKRWSNFPITMVPRAGISFKEMNPAQTSAAMASRSKRSTNSWREPCTLSSASWAATAARRKEAGLSLAQLAIAWTLQNPNVSAAIIGATRAEQVRENVKAAGVTLEPETMKRIDDVLGPEIVRDQDQIASPATRS